MKASKDCILLCMNIPECKKKQLRHQKFLVPIKSSILTSWILMKSSVSSMYSFNCTMQQSRPSQHHLSLTTTLLYVTYCPVKLFSMSLVLLRTKPLQKTGNLLSQEFGCPLEMWWASRSCDFWEYSFMINISTKYEIN